MLATSTIAALVLAAIAAAGATAGATVHGVEARNTNQRNRQLADWLRQTYPELSQTQIEGIVSQYGDKQINGLFDFANWGDQSDTSGLQNLMKQVNEAYEKFGYQPEAPSEADLDRIMNDAYSEIDAENNRLLNMYQDTFNDSRQALKEEIANNNAMFTDYRNQMLTNEAMQQQAIAGSTRFELDRQQRNAITRGASAAQRLVTNINTQLGLQAQSAQQSLDTSNALAQNLLAHRQAQQGARDAYLSSRNAYNAQVANNLSGQAERRLNYGRAARQNAIDKYNYAYDQWNDQINNYFQGNSLGAGIYRNRYGSGSNKNAI